VIFSRLPVRGVALFLFRQEKLQKKPNRGREFDLSPAKKSSLFSPSLELLVF